MYVCIYRSFYLGYFLEREKKIVSTPALFVTILTIVDSHVFLLFFVAHSRLYVQMRDTRSIPNATTREFFCFCFFHGGVAVYHSNVVNTEFIVAMTFK